MADRRIYVETLVKGDLDTLWRRTQDPAEHSRWDLRFSEIVQQPTPAGQAQRFRYTVWLPGLRALRVSGTGVSVGERHAADGSRTSALRFVSANRWSPIRSGSGYWRYVHVDGGLRFLTGYQYEPGPQGRLLDDLVVRPIIAAMTAWSFDRLRLWVETDLLPEVAARRSAQVLASRGIISAALLVGAATGRGRGWPWRAAAAIAAILALVVPVAVPRPRAGRSLRRAPDRLGQLAPTTLSELTLPGAAAS